MNQEFGNSMRDRFGYRKFVWLLVLASGVFLLSIGTEISPAFGNIGNDRVALLIGNADYSGKDKLENPVNDVNDYGKALRQAGFTVEIKTNLGRSELFDAIQDFSKRVKNINGIALLHYAGHGFRADDTNYIVPIGVKTDGGKEKLTNESVRAEEMVKLLGDSPTRVNVVILDMCRNLPSRGIRGNEGGLAPMKPGTGTLMAFSTQSGKTAQDGAGLRNSPYARNLIAALSQQDLTVTDYFAVVRANVRKDTNNEQEPREDSALVGRAPTLLASGPAPAGVVLSSSSASSVPGSSSSGSNRIALQTETSPEFSFNVGVPSAEECRSPLVLKINSNLEKDVVYNAISSTGGDKYLSLAKSKISVFEPRVGALKLCTKAKDWIRVSSIVPGDGKPVVTFRGECDYRGVVSNEAVYVIFTERLGNITSDGQDTVEKFFYPKSRWYETPAGREAKVYNKYLVKDYEYFKTSCLKLQKE